MNISIPTGTFDIIPCDPKNEWRSSHFWNYVEEIMRDQARLYGFQEIRTPLFERTELFCRSVGDSSDIISKEMYTFEDKGGRMLSLRPEGTAAVVRAFVEKQLQTQQPIHRFFYIGPMFRYERPQSGRYRQHHQLGVEVIGFSGPELDAELIEMCYSLYARLGLQNLQVQVNSVGDKESRLRFRTALKEYLQPHLSALSEESQRRFETNPLRIFDSKNEKDKEIVKGAPTILDYLNDDCRDHFSKVCKTLDLLNIPYQVNPCLVRGLDYYSKTVFEIVSGELGAQNTIGAGGRYDGLVKELGGPDLPSIGFATGIERVLQTMLGQKVSMPALQGVMLYLIPLGEMALLSCFSLARKIRDKGIACIVDTTGKKLKTSMQMAQELQALYTIVLGENELASKQCEIKEMATGKTEKMALDEVPSFFTIDRGI
jgi:histidyl-tRNA synthetase